MEPNTQPHTQPDPQRDPQLDPRRDDSTTADVAPEVRERNKPSGAQYVEPSPLGIEPVVQTGVDRQTNPPRSNERPEQTAEVPLGTGTHPEPAGGGGRASHKN
jgi:hypothetical protein